MIYAFLPAIGSASLINRCQRASRSFLLVGMMYDPRAAAISPLPRPPSREGGEKSRRGIIVVAAGGVERIASEEKRVTLGVVTANGIEKKRAPRAAKRM
jgi:hypothetical protein